MRRGHLHKHTESCCNNRKPSSMTKHRDRQRKHAALAGGGSVHKQKRMLCLGRRRFDVGPRGLKVSGGVRGLIALRTRRTLLLRCLRERSGARGGGGNGALRTRGARLSGLVSEARAVSPAAQTVGPVHTFSPRRARFSGEKEVRLSEENPGL